MEDILHYVWKFKLYNRVLQTTDGQAIEVIDPGVSNANEGPDFFNAKIKIGDKLWVGNIEIHVASSDWMLHKHEQNKSYDSVVLHVVKEADCEVKNSEGRSIMQCEMRYPQSIDENYDFLIHSNIDLPCVNYFAEMDRFHLSSWMNNLLMERLERKAKDIDRLFSRLEGSWEEVFYVLLSRSFGFGLNSDSFERLALSLPLRYIQKHGDNIVQIEALLFGQAGMLEDEQAKDSYHGLLQKEYEFLRHKYGLKPLEKHVFKNLRTRPTAFPQIRIAQLVALLHSSQGLFSKVVDKKEVGQIRLLLHVNASEYWQTHYTFGAESAKKSKFLGDSSLDILLINAVSPILFAYGKYIGDEDMCERALRLLEEIKAEKNSISKLFSKNGVTMNSAADSQAVIQLKREYCEKRKCLYCRVGHRLLAKD